MVVGSLSHGSLPSSALPCNLGTSTHTYLSDSLTLYLFYFVLFCFTCFTTLCLCSVSDQFQKKKKTIWADRGFRKSSNAWKLD